MSELQKKALGFKQDFIFLKTHSGLFEIDGTFYKSAKYKRDNLYSKRS